MKRNIFLMILVLLTIVGNTYADNLAVENFAIAPGETKTISIELNNPDSPYIMVEFWMSLPNGISIPMDEYGYYLAEGNTSRFTRTHSLEVNKQDGLYHFLIFSSRNDAIKGNSGELISLTVEADGEAQAGTYTAKISNQLYNDPNKNEVTPNDVTFDITVDSQEPTEVSITIPAEGATTYCPSYDLDFNGVTGFKAYVATSYNRTKSIVVMKQAVDAPAGTGLFLKGTPGTYTVPVNGTKNSYADMLVGTTTITTIPATEGKKTNLTFSSNDTFTAATNNEAIEANRAWLQLPSALYDGQSVTIEYDIDGDMNHDGIVDVTDIMIIVNIILGN